MSTIDSKDIVKVLLEHDGVYPGTDEEPDDPQCYTIHSYTNQWGNPTFHLAYSARDYDALVGSPFVHNPQLLWSKASGLTELGRSLISDGKEVKPL